MPLDSDFEILLLTSVTPTVLFNKDWLLHKQKCSYHFEFFISILKCDRCLSAMYFITEFTDRWPRLKCYSYWIVHFIASQWAQVYLNNIYLNCLPMLSKLQFFIIFVDPFFTLFKCYCWLICIRFYKHCLNLAAIV